MSLPSVSAAEARRLICAALGPSDLKPAYRSAAAGRDPLYGHCYVASQALYFSQGGYDSGWTVWQVRVPGEGSHWFLKNPQGDVVDPTASQFAPGAVPYDRAVKKAWVSQKSFPGPDKRTRRVLARTGLDRLDERELGGRLDNPVFNPDARSYSEDGDVILYAEIVSKGYAAEELAELASPRAAKTLGTDLAREMDGDEVLYVYDIAVQENRQRAGLGRRAVEEMLADAASKGVTDAWLYACGVPTTRAVAFWRSLGFVTVYATEHGCAVMRRRLGEERMDNPARADTEVDAVLAAGGYFAAELEQNPYTKREEVQVRLYPRGAMGRGRGAVKGHGAASFDRAVRAGKLVLVATDRGAFRMYERVLTGDTPYQHGDQHLGRPVARPTTEALAGVAALRERLKQRVKDAPLVLASDLRALGALGRVAAHRVASYDRLSVPVPVEVWLAVRSDLRRYLGIASDDQLREYERHVRCQA